MQNQVTACPGRYYWDSLVMAHRLISQNHRILPTGKEMGTANLRENIRTPFVPGNVSSESLPLLPKPHAHGTALQNSHFIPHRSTTQMALLSSPHTLPPLPAQPLGGFSPLCEANLSSQRRPSLWAGWAP